jgi:hypothetical protein
MHGLTRTDSQIARICAASRLARCFPIAVNLDLFGPFPMALAHAGKDLEALRNVVPSRSPTSRVILLMTVATGTRQPDIIAKARGGPRLPRPEF